ncbi:MAG TPA: hypothetical protein VN914_03485 [Polyangia bacterium]|nr:hypothetical protein [Polyangia bacterium]
MHRSVLLAGLLVIASPARAEETFAGCEAQAVARDGWKAICKAGWVLSAADGREELPAAELVNVLEQGLAQASQGKVRRSTLPLELPGKWTVIKLEVEGAKDVGPNFALVASTKIRQGSRVLSCTGIAATEEPCKRAMQAVAKTGWRSGPPPGLAHDRSAPSFAGRPYRVPKGCEVIKQQNATAIGCGGEPVLFWTEDTAAFATLDGFMTSQILQSGMKEGGPVPCSVDGVSTRCRSYLPKVASDARSAYVAQVSVRGQPVLVACLAAASTKPLPPPCAAILKVERPKP